MHNIPSDSTLGALFKPKQTQHFRPKSYFSPKDPQYTLLPPVPISGRGAGCHFLPRAELNADAITPSQPRSPHMDSLLLSPHHAHQIPKTSELGEVITSRVTYGSRCCSEPSLPAPLPGRPTQEVYFDDGCFLPGYGSSFAGSALRGCSEPGAEGWQPEGSGSRGTGSVGTSAPCSPLRVALRMKRKRWVSSNCRHSTALCQQTQPTGEAEPNVIKSICINWEESQLGFPPSNRSQKGS